MYCNQCGSKLADQSKFCSHCGTPIFGGEQPSPTPFFHTIPVQTAAPLEPPHSQPIEKSTSFRTYAQWIEASTPTKQNGKKIIIVVIVVLILFLILLLSIPKEKQDTRSFTVVRLSKIFNNGWVAYYGSYAIYFPPELDERTVEIKAALVATLQADSCYTINEVREFLPWIK